MQVTLERLKVEAGDGQSALATTRPQPGARTAQRWPHRVQVAALLHGAAPAVVALLPFGAQLDRPAGIVQRLVGITQLEVCGSAVAAGAGRRSEGPCKDGSRPGSAMQRVCTKERRAALTKLMGASALVSSCTADLHRREVRCGHLRTASSRT